MTNHTVILVHATSHALRAEKLIRNAGISCRLIPLPRQFSADCGVCVRVNRGDREAALALLKEALMEIDNAYDVE